jgi:hypothetical protein
VDEEASKGLGKCLLPKAKEALGQPKSRPTIAIHKLCDEWLEVREGTNIYMYMYVCMYEKGAMGQGECVC